MANGLLGMTPQQMGLLGAAAGLLEASGPSRVPVGLGQAMGRGLMSGLGTFQQAQQAETLETLRKTQMEKAKRDAEEAERLRQAQAALLPQLTDPAARALAQAGDFRGAIGRQFPEQSFTVQTVQGPTGPQLAWVPTRPGGQIQSTGAAPFRPELDPAIRNARIQDRVNLERQLQPLMTQRRAAGAPSVTQINTAEDPFMKAVGKGFGEQFAKRGEDARVAATSLQNIREGKRLLDSGIVTGVGAELVTKGGQLFGQLGLLGDDARETIANTQTFAANMGREVGSVIRLFGSGTGLSDADREYAQKIAGGQITLDEKALKKLLDINERLAVAKIKAYNKEAEEFLKTPQGARLPRSSVIIDLPEGGSLPKEGGQPSRSVVRRGTAPDGRRVIQYSDGSVEYE